VAKQINQTGTDETAQDPTWKSFVAIAFFIVLVLSVYAICMPFLFPKMTDRAQFGDMFGATNPLFSGLAFAGVIYAIVLQRNELRLQRQELAETRRELARSAAAHQETAEIQSTQAELSLLAARLSATLKIAEIEELKNTSSGDFTAWSDSVCKPGGSTLDQARRILKKLDEQGLSSEENMG